MAIWLALMLAPPPLLPPPPPERPALERELEEELAEDAEALAEEDAALPAALIVAVSTGNFNDEAELAAGIECTVFAPPELFVIKGLILFAEEETAEISMIGCSLSRGPSPGM